MPSAARLALKFFRKKPVRSSTQTSLTASTAVPNSGFVFVNNLQGASAALDEFSGVLSTALEHVDLNGGDSEGGPAKTQLKGLEQAVADYANSTTETCCNLIDWKCDSSTAELAVAAFKCAAAVYTTGSHVDDDAGESPTINNLDGIHRKPEIAGLRFHELDYAAPSLGGSAKAVGCWSVVPEAGVSENPDLPALIIAVRGTATFVDHIVNINSRPVAASEFFGLHKYKFFDDFMEEFSVHSGFLSSARRLHSRIQNHLTNISQEGKIAHVVFTGHSAGGAVAILLYLKFLLDPDPACANLKFSCLTFGAPPSLSADITDAINSEPSCQSNRGMNLAFVNEFDMVCRMDQSYFRSLIDLFRSIYDLDPVMSNEIPRKGTDESGTSSDMDAQFVLPPLYFPEDTKQSVTADPGESLSWPLPLPEYHTFGDLVLLRKEQNAYVKSGEGSGKELRALSIRAHDLEKLLYCAVRTHRRTVYDERMELLRRGKFNYENGW